MNVIYKKETDPKPRSRVGTALDALIDKNKDWGSSPKRTKPLRGGGENR